MKKLLSGMAVAGLSLLSVGMAIASPDEDDAEQALSLIASDYVEIGTTRFSCGAY